MIDEKDASSLSESSGTSNSKKEEDLQEMEDSLNSSQRYNGKNEK